MSRYTVFSLLRDLNRASRSVAYHSRVEENRQQRAYAKMRALEERARKVATKQEKARYIADRSKAVEEMNDAVSASLQELDTVLKHTLTINDTVEFDTLLTKNDFPPFAPPKEVEQPAVSPVKRIADMKIRPLNFFERLFHSKRIERQQQSRLVLQAQYDSDYQREIAAHQKHEEERIKKLAQLQEEYDSKKAAFIAEATAKNAEVAKFKEAYRQGDAQAVEDYNNLVLDRSEYDEQFPHEHEVTYVTESKYLTIKKALPALSVVPSVAEYRYVKSSDTITEKARLKVDIKKIYTSLVCQIALRSIHEVFEADQGKWIDRASFDGYVKAVDPAKGEHWTPTIVNLTVTASDFKQIRLGYIDPLVCFTSLDGRLAKKLDGTMSLD